MLKVHQFIMFILWLSYNWKFRRWSYYIRQLFICPATKTIPDRASVHTQNWNCVGMISVTEQSCVTPASKAESHISHRCSWYTRQLFMAPQKGIQYRLGEHSLELFRWSLLNFYILRCSSAVFRPFLQLWQSIDQKNSFALS